MRGRRVRTLVVIASVLSFAIFTGGCSQGPSTKNPKGLVGSWVVVVPTDSDGALARFDAVATGDYHFTFFEDGTFEDRRPGYDVKLLGTYELTSLKDQPAIKLDVEDDLIARTYTYGLDKNTLKLAAGTASLDNPSETMTFVHGDPAEDERIAGSWLSLDGKQRIRLNEDGRYSDTNGDQSGIYRIARSKIDGTLVAIVFTPTGSETSNLSSCGLDGDTLQLGRDKYKRE
jgi:hypothetical protein